MCQHNPVLSNVGCYTKVVEPLSISFLVSLAAPGLQKLLGRSAAALADTPVGVAAQLTADAYPDFPDLRDQLLSYAASEAISECVHNAEALGSGVNIDERLLEAFLREFYLPNADPTVPRAILSTFHANLLGRLLASEQAPQVLYSEIKTTQVKVDAMHAALMAQAPLQTQPNYAASDATGSSFTEERDRVVSAKLDAVRSLIDSGRIVAAKDILADIASLMTDRTDPFLRWRYRNNLGACHLALNEYGDAQREFEIGQQLRPSEPISIANLATVKLCVGDLDAAETYARDALSAEGWQPNALAVLLQVLSCRGDEDGVFAVKVRYPKIEDAAQTCLTLALHYLERGDFEEAERLARRATALEPDSEAAHRYLARIVAEAVRCKLRESRPEPWRIAPGTRSRLEEAAREFGVSLRLLQNTDLEHERADALVGRAQTRSLLGQDEAALSDLSTLPVAHEADETVIHLKGALLAAVGRHHEALREFEKLPLESGTRIVTESPRAFSGDR